MKKTYRFAFVLLISFYSTYALLCVRRKAFVCVRGAGNVSTFPFISMHPSISMQPVYYPATHHSQYTGCKSSRRFAHQNRRPEFFAYSGYRFESIGRGFGFTGQRYCQCRRLAVLHKCRLYGSFTQQFTHTSMGDGKPYDTADIKIDKK